VKPRRWLKLFVGSAAVALLLVAANYFYVEYYAAPYVHDPDEAPPYRVALLLGTAKYTRGKKANPFYEYRIHTALNLWKNKKTRYFLISGDNSSKYYNEPLQMKKDLVAGGVPPDRIFLDYAGFSTYDSMVRAKEIFGLDSLLVISQDFHVKRAIFIGRHKGMTVEGVRTRNVSGHSHRRMLVREAGARLKATWDLLTGTRPKFLGEKIRIR